MDEKREEAINNMDQNETPFGVQENSFETESASKVEIDELKASVKDLIEENARLRAEFQNFKTAIRREAEEQVRRSKERTVLRIIDIYMDLNRALANSQNRDDGLFLGIELISKSMEKLMSDEGVSFIEPEIGMPFDPFANEVDETVSTNEVPDMAVYKVNAIGYNFNGKVLRPARVVVALNSSPADE
ncbi:MAG TPA: nucleotide exchange factor GrpE [Mesotoga sp.]|nr:nucleotide exchange factor GrpE [Mesotoga sp.]